MVVLIVPIFAAGTLAAYASFDLEPGSAFFHCALYFAVTVLLRLVAGLRRFRAWEAEHEARTVVVVRIAECELRIANLQSALQSAIRIPKSEIDRP